MIFFDTESVGKTGPLVTVQYCIDSPDNGNIFWQIWDKSVESTLWLFELFCVHPDGIVGFNLAHDWFMVNKWYNIFRQVENKSEGPNEKEIQAIEARGPQVTDVCLKPVKACDLMLLARSGNYQYLAKHKSIVIRKVPTQICSILVRELDRLLQLPEGVTINWRISEKRTNARGDVKDLIGTFSGLSTSLKHLASVVMQDASIAKGTFDEEVGRVPYKDEPDWKPWGGNWLSGLTFLRERFRLSSRAIRYATNDVLYTYQLWRAMGLPRGGDDDSELACLVGALQWKGFAVASPDKLMEMIKRYAVEEKSAPTSPNAVYDYLSACLDPTERMLLTDTKKATLEEFGRWDGHPVAAATKKVQTARRAQRRLDILRKLLKAGGFYFSMKVSGTLSSRMAGGSEHSDGGGGGGKLTKLNPQGIPHEKEFRQLFTLAQENEHLEGGDFDAFETSIAEALYQDKQLTQDIINSQENPDEFKFAALIGTMFYGGTVKDILRTKGQTEDLYDRAKRGFFSYLYGGTVFSIRKHLDLPEDTIERGLARVKERYPKIKDAMNVLRERFTAIFQDKENGIVEWREPDEYIESLLGFKRYFTLEWAIIRGLYELGSSPPEEWSNIHGVVRRTNRPQSVINATRSALFSAIFSLQSHVFRAAANHVIQSTGAQITKMLQRKIWDLQPCGIGPWRVRPLNIHDEVLCPTSLQQNVVAAQTTQSHQESHGLLSANVVRPFAIHETVGNTVRELQQKIPFLKMTWKSNLKNWGEK